MKRKKSRTEAAKTWQTRPTKGAFTFLTFASWCEMLNGQPVDKRMELVKNLCEEFEMFEIQ
eukprot:Nk52_evm1s2565 gene=Nk52_evmTU1s2565